MRKKPVPRGRRDFTSRRLRQKRKECTPFWRGRSRCCNTAMGQSFAAFEARAAHSRHFGLPASRLCRNTRNLIDVMLSKAKHLAFSGCYKVEILRLRPQNDIATQSPRGEGIVDWTFIQITK